MKATDADDFRDQVRRAGGMVTDGPVPDDFSVGWAKHPFKGQAVHYWTADRRFDLGAGAYGVLSMCGITTVATAAVPLLGAGNYPFCAHCENVLMATMGKEAKA